MNDYPLISVIIPAYNSEKTIGTALESMMKQTYHNLEIIVVDDQSTDGTQAIVEGFSKKDARVRYYKSPFQDPHRFNKRGRNINAGYSARNFGLEQAHGELITFQDADDASLLNRIDIQYELLLEHKAMHVCLDWQKFDERLIGKRFDAHRYIRDNPHNMMRPHDIVQLAEKNKGIAHAVLGRAASKINFEIKRFRGLHRLFFKRLDPYPGTGNSPLFRRTVIEKVKFRKLADRVWPSFVGRGADRDFNFQVAETFGQSYVFFIPMYLWKQEKQNERYGDIEKYLI